MKLKFKVEKGRMKEKSVRFVVFGLVLVLLASAAVGTASAFSNSGGVDWKYYKEITVKENSGKTLTDFQVLVDLNPSNFPANANSDGSDLRFEDTNSKELSYWIEEWNGGAKSAKIWIKVPSIPANGETKIKMYYGNPRAGAVSDGDKVFEFFDDFEDGDVSDWDITVISSSHSIVDESGNLYQQHKSSKAGPTSCGCNCYRDHKIDMKKRLNLPVNTYVVELYGRETACWGYGLCLYLDSTKYIFEPQQNFCYNNADTRQWRWLHSDPLTIPIGMFYLERHDQTSAGYEEIDVIRIRKYTSLKPTLILSAEIPTTAPTPTPPSVPIFVPHSNNPLLTSHAVPRNSVFKLSDDEYHMFFVEQRSSEDYPADFNADLLISTDGLNWDVSSIHRNVVSSQQSGHTFNYYVGTIKEGDEYKAWHSATSDWNIAGTKLYYSTSKDGIHYSGHGMVLDNEPYSEYDSRNINYPWIVFDGNTYHLYYGAYPGHQSGSPDRSYHWTIAYATSSDGIHWKKHGVVIDPGMSPAVVYDGTKFEMLYNVQNGDEVVVKYAVSYDGLKWEELGDVDSIDGWVMGLAKENGVYQVWYSNKETVSGLYEYKLHYATAKEQVIPTPTFTPTPAPPTPPSGKIKAVWLYNPDKYDTSTLMNDFKSAGINTIFLSTDVNNIWKSERFVKSSHENGIEVHAMILEDPRCALKENHASAIKAVETVLDYNDKSLAKFDGINIDTEPYVDLDLEQVWQDYITLLDAIHEKTAGKTVLSADIPRWYDEGKIKDLVSNLDFFVIMAYDSGGAGWNTASEIEDAVASEMGAIRGEDSDAVIGIGVHEGFRDKDAVEKCIEDLYNYYSDDPAFHGVSIFKYESYSGLAGAPEVTVPTGEEVTPIPGFEAVFSIAGLLTVAYLLRRRK
jgi:PGF-CTERM protein